MSKNPYFFILFSLFSLFSLSACLAPGTQTAGSGPGAGPLSAGGGSTDTVLPGPSDGGAGGAEDEGAEDAGIDAAGETASSLPSVPGRTGDKWPGSIYAQAPGLPSGQVAPSEPVGGSGSLVMDGTKERLCRTGETVTVRVSGQLVLLLKDGSEKKKNFSIYPPVVRFYSSGEGWASYADVPVVQNSSGYYMVEGTIATKYPASVRFHGLNPFTNVFEFDIPSRVQDVGPESPPSCDKTIQMIQKSAPALHQVLQN